MGGETGMTRAALEALIWRMLDAETRTSPPLAGEAGDWLYGSAKFTEPEEQGWIASLPSAHVWRPRALVFWHMVVRMGTTASEEQRRDPRLSLARWPAIEAAVQRGVGDSPSVMK